MTFLDLPKRDARERANRLLHKFGLADKADSHPARLSTGQCQRIALARALVNDPDLLLLDEPTASLDIENGRIVMDLIRSVVNELQKTVVVVTHDPRIFQYADVIHWLESGRIANRETPQFPAVATVKQPKEIGPMTLPTPIGADVSRSH
jgi:putative ABC transport system ATP-binding protein